MGVIRTLTWPLSELVPVRKVQVTNEDGTIRFITPKQFNKNLHKVNRQQYEKAYAAQNPPVPFIETELYRLIVITAKFSWKYAVIGTRVTWSFVSSRRIWRRKDR